MSLLESANRQIEKSFNKSVSEIASTHKINKELAAVAIVAPLAGQVGDILSTYKALSIAGTKEGNPLMKHIVNNKPVFVGIKLAAGAYVSKQVHKAYSEGRTNKAKVISVVGSLAGFLPAISNINLIRNHK